MANGSSQGVTSIEQITERVLGPLPTPPPAPHADCSACPLQAQVINAVHNELADHMRMMREAEVRRLENINTVLEKLAEGMDNISDRLSSLPCQAGQRKHSRKRRTS